MILIQAMLESGRPARLGKPSIADGFLNNFRIYPLTINYMAAGCLFAADCFFAAQPSAARASAA